MRCRCTTARKGRGCSGRAETGSLLCRDCDAEGCQAWLDSDGFMTRLVVEGMQVVLVDGRWGFTWRGISRLKVGQVVVLPGNDYTNGFNWLGEVTGEGSSWEGVYRQVIRVANARDLVGLPFPARDAT